MSRPCPDCADRHIAVCRCDQVTCMVCEERWVHVDEAICCAVPGCKNTEICAHDFQCYELIEEQPVCSPCMNALDSQSRIWAVVRRVKTRRGLNPPATDLDPCREMHEARS